MQTILRPLSTSELLDRTSHLYRNHFLMFVTITAIPQLLVLALHAADAALWLRVLLASRVMRSFLFLIMSLLGLQISHAATAIAVSRLHLGETASVREAYSAAKGSLLRVVWIVSMTYVLPLILCVLIGLVGVGVSAGILAAAGMFQASDATSIWFRIGVIFLVFLAAPLLAMRWWLAWALTVPVTALEGGGLRTTIRRSRSLTSGRRGRIFGIYVLIVIVTYVVQLLFQTPYYILAGAQAFTAHGHVGAMRIMVSAIGAFLSTSLVGPLLEIALTLIYYDERVPKEGFDLQLMMSNLENAAPAAATVPAS
jgi:hypothetical protein